MARSVLVGFLFLGILVASAVAQGAGSATVCAASQTVTIAGSFSGTVLELNYPRTSTIVVQAVPGANWGATLYGDAARLGALSATSAVSGGKLGITVTDSSAPTQTTRPPTTGTAASTPPVMYYCNRGTLVITYPPGGELFVNGLRYPTCSDAGGSGSVQTPVKYNTTANWPVRGNTFWFSAPAIIDLDMDSSCVTDCNELIACSADCRVWDSDLQLIQTVPIGSRVYTPMCVADLDGNGKMDLCAAASRSVYCYEWQGKATGFTIRAGFPQDVSKGDKYPTISGGELRGMGCGDLDNDGAIDVVVSTTNSEIQYYAFDAWGVIKPGWPRYNTQSGPTNDADPDAKKYDGINGFGHYRYGSYGLNVGIGNMDDTPDLEVIGTFDDHQIQAFKADGQGINVAPYYKNNRSPAKGAPVTWGQATPRWTNLTTDDYQWHFGANGACYPNPYSNPCVPGGDEWLQFTQSPGSVIDIDGDGMAEVVSLPNSEKGSPYATQARALFVLQGAYGNSGDPRSNSSTTSGLRKPGFDGTFPPKGRGITCPQCSTSAGCGTCRVDSYYPPQSVPSPAFADLTGSGKLDIVFSYGDGTVSASSASGVPRWTFDFSADTGINYLTDAIESSEPVIVDLNADGVPEVIFATYGKPAGSQPMSSVNNQNLYCLSNTGTLIWRVPYNTAATGATGSGNGNGAGAAGAPTVGDLDGDGELEIVIHTFDGRVLIWTVPGSAPNCLVWPTARGGYLRKGQPDVSYSG